MISKNTRSWLLFGFAIPILAEFIGAILIVSTDSGASAEGFAGIVILVMLIIAVPITLIGNGIIVSGQLTDKLSYLRRGMILPVLFIAASLVYYTGFWDNVIHPIFPRHVEKIQTAGAHLLDENTYESFFVVNSYTGSSEELKEIENYANKKYAEYTWTSRNHIYYFVPHELYDPFDDSLNRERAVAVFRYMSTDETPTIEKITLE